MKKLCILGLIIFLVGCENKVWNNPFDSKSTIKKEEWTPENFTIEQTSLTSFQLSWKSIDENIEGYRIDRKIGDLVWIENLIKVEVDSLQDISISDTTVTPDTRFEYSYRLYAYAGKHLSNPIEEKISPEFPSIGNFTIEQLAPSVLKIQWQNNTVGEDGFYLKKKVDDGDWFSIDTLVTGTTTYVDSSAIPNHENAYEITIYYDKYYCTCESIASNTEFKAPSSFDVVKLSLESLKLSWNDNATGEDGYIIDRKENGGEWQIGYVSLDENSEEFIDTDIITNYSYNYRVYAVYGEYTTDKINDYIEVNFDAPQNMQFDQKNLSEIEITWDADDQGEEGFRLYREDEFGQWQLICETENENFTDTSPNYGENNYKLYAYYNDQKSDSLEQSFTNILDKPTEFTSEILSGTSVKLEWQNNCEFEHSISLERKTEGNDYQQIALLSSDIDEYTDTTIDSTITYEYAIRAYVDPHYSEYSDIETVLVVKPLPFETVDVLGGDFIYGQNNSTQNVPYDYVISKYEVTNAEFASYLQAAYNDGLLSVTSTEVSGNYSGDIQYSEGEYLFYDLDDDYSKIYFSNGTFSVESGYENHPVVKVSWFGANAFSAYYRCHLPSDFEWEKAARGNTTRVYPWGDDLATNYCNYQDSGDPYDNGTTPVGYFDGSNQNGYTTRDNRSYYGAYDMAGNVWEWTSSWNTDGSNKRIARGGSWYNSTSMLNTYYRFPNNPVKSYGYIGFRVVRKK